MDGNKVAMSTGSDLVHHLGSRPHLGGATASSRVVEARHGRVDRDDAMTTVGAWVVNMGDRAIGGVRNGWLEMLARVGHVTSVVVGHLGDNDWRVSYKGREVMTVGEERLTTDTKVVDVIQVVVGEESWVGERWLSETETVVPWEVIVRSWNNKGGARVRMNTIWLAWNLVNTSLLSERGVDAIDAEALGSVGHSVVEAGTSMLEAGAGAFAGLLLGRLVQLSSGLLALSGLRSRLSDRDLVLDSSLHGLLLGGLRPDTHCEGNMMSA